RAVTDIGFSFSINGQSGQEYTGIINNISLSGAFLSKLQPLLTPEHISQTGLLKIGFDDEELPLACEIVYISPPDNQFFPVGAGVVFSDTDTKIQAAVTKLAAALELDFASN
ncbi:MAG: PilZ domain-containing protein, partial [Methylovulum sp.]|nr:PilZ domain-containing protein [Methylovulum sp.]